MLLDADTWAGLESGAPAIGRYVLGLDLGQNAAMSAAVAYWPAGRLEALAVFPEVPPLAERGLSDGVGDLYRRMAERGELLQAGRRVSDVRALLGEVLSRWGRPAVVVCDRWREAELRQALEAVRFPLADLSIRGQGFKDGGEDVRRFRRAILSGHVRPEPGLLLAAALAEGPRGRRSGGQLETVEVRRGRAAPESARRCGGGGDSGGRRGRPAVALRARGGATAAASPVGGVGSGHPTKGVAMRLSEVVHRVILSVTSVGGLVFVIGGVVAMVDGWSGDGGRMFDDGFEYAGFGPGDADAGGDSRIDSPAPRGARDVA